MAAQSPHESETKKSGHRARPGHDCPDAKDNAPSLVRHGGRGGGRPAVEGCLLRVQGAKSQKAKGRRMKWESRGIAALIDDTDFAKTACASRRRRARIVCDSEA